MNVQFNYLYRDAGNSQQFGRMVFTNQSNLPITVIEAAIKESLITEQYFYVNEWQLPDLHFYKWDNDLDHTWHEFESIEETNEVAEGKDIAEFLNNIATLKKQY